jgi:hypothetical protein
VDEVRRRLEHSRGHKGRRRLPVFGDGHGTMNAPCILPGTARRW